jgi:hypothetical protein
MKKITRLLILSVVAYSLGIVYTVHWGDLWLFLTFVFVLGLGYDVHSYIRLKQGKPIITYRTIFKKKPEKVDANSGFFIGDKENRRRQNVDS